MQTQERALRDLLIQIARGEIGGDRFNNLLLQTGVFLDDLEWEFANRLLEKSDQVMTLATEFTVPCQWVSLSTIDEIDSSPERSVTMRGKAGSKKFPWFPCDFWFLLDIFP